MAACKRTPRIVEGGLVDVELGFGQTTSGYNATGVGDLLDVALGFEKLIELSTQGNVFPANDLLSNHFESERGITNPSVEVVRVNGARAGNDDSGLRSEVFGQTETGAKGRRTFAPEDLEPLGPILAKRPDLAIGDSFAM